MVGSDEIPLCGLLRVGTTARTVAVGTHYFTFSLRDGKA